MNLRRPTALLAEDEPLLRKSLVRLLEQAWPDLEILAEARGGREALERFEALRPDVCFLDVHMPGFSGLEVARRVGTRAHLVFVTAFDRYAVEAFEQGAVDYLLKPVEPERLALAVSRLKERLRTLHPVRDLAPILDLLLTRLGERTPITAQKPLQWLRISVGKTVRVLPVEEIEYLRSEDKYTLVAWRAAGGAAGDGLVRTPLRVLLPLLDSTRFVQVHRSVIVNLSAVSHLTRDSKETGLLHLRHRKETLPVSRTFLPFFHQM